jgi:hypothetical protein
MAIKSVRDVVDAFNEGRFHVQRAIKTGASQTGDGQWQDWSFTAGQPGYDARVGTSGKFNPFVAQRNDAIYFPPIPSTMERRLAGFNLFSSASGNDQVTVSYAMYDLLGVYPLIDGDSAELVEMDNTETLPRYVTGDGVYAILVCHVSPTLATGSGTMVYTSCDGSEKTTTFGIRNTGVNKACGSISVASATDANLFIPLASGCRGVRSVKSIQLSGTSSGLFSLYLVKPVLFHTNTSGITGVNVKQWGTYCACTTGGYKLPKIEDGAWLGLFYMPQGGARTVSNLHGEFTFIWG